MKGDAVAEESIEVRVARLEERDKGKDKTLESIAKGIGRIEDKLSKHLPCEKNDLRIGNLETTVNDDHEDRIDKVESFRDKWSGRMMILGPAAFIIATTLATLIAGRWG
jgi:hypothetical protein